jgi:hypothetical protein
VVVSPVKICGEDVGSHNEWLEPIRLWWGPYRGGGLPHSFDVSFTLLSPKQIKQRATHRGNFMYIWIAWLRIKGDQATISIGTEPSVSRWDRTFLLASSGYILEYRKVEGDWRFERVVIVWIH